MRSNMSRDTITEVIRFLMKDAHTTAVEKGWWNESKPRSFGDMIALMHSELSEAVEEYRNNEYALYHSENTRKTHDGKPVGITSEFADVLIRIFDYCQRENLPLAEVLIDKMVYNTKRAYRHAEYADTKGKILFHSGNPRKKGKVL